MEAGARSLVQRNWILLFHHSVFHTLNLLGERRQSECLGCKPAGLKCKGVE